MPYGLRKYKGAFLKDRSSCFWMSPNVRDLENTFSRVLNAAIPHNVLPSLSPGCGPTVRYKASASF